MVGMKTVCATSMPFVEEAFRTFGDVVVREGRKMTADDVRDADLLAIRSTTKVNRALLEGSRVRFVGTATIGFDHIDTAWCEAQGIRWCSAAGCNANSVSEYVASALLCLGNRYGFTLEGKTIGVIGVGNVGSRVVQKALALGMRVLPNDPPRARLETRNAEHGTRIAGVPESSTLHPPPSTLPFASLDQVLAEADIITLHVPLAKEGPDRTWYMADRHFFERMKPSTIFINSARGPVVVTDCLIEGIRDGSVGYAVIDTWDGEPAIPLELLERADLGTPHIAGYSYDGKVNGTVRVYREACAFLGREPTWRPDDLLPPPRVPRVDVDAACRTDEAVVWSVVRKVYDVAEDDANLRALLTGDVRALSAATHFDALRRDYPDRREFPFTTVHVLHSRPALVNKLRGLGFPVIAHA
jgi:erythronate-4-phosphate dehydrogenase